MTQDQFELPNQRIPESKWTKKLYIEHANRMLEFVGNKTLSSRNEKLAGLYRSYSAELSPKEIKTNESVTKQYGHDLGVEYMIYPLSEMLVDQLVGEYISLPSRQKLYSINKDAINERLDEKLNYINEEIFRKINKDMEGQLGFVPETENPEIDLPDDIELFFSKNYKTNEEELGDDLIVHFLKVLKEERTIKTLLQDYLIGEQAYAHIDEKDGHPTIVRAKYDESYIDLDPNDEIQRDINIYASFPYKTKNEILNNYYLTKEQLDKVDNMFKRMIDHSLLDQPFSYGSSVQEGPLYQNCKQGVSYKGWYDSTSSNRIRTMVMMWKSRKEVRAKVIVNKHTGKKEYKILTKDYKERKKDKIEKTSVEVARYIEMLGPELCLDYGEMKERISYIDNKKKIQLPVTALRGRNTMFSDEVRSVVAKTVQLQKIASDILFELRLAIKASNGRVLVYDAAQIPKQFLDAYGKKGAINRMLHHVKKDKILIFNSKDKASRNTFNQFTALDMSNRGQVQDLINSLMLIESLAKKFVGLSPERQGESEKYQTATANQRAVIGSNARTEIYFNPFDEFFQDLLNKMLMKSKHIYKKGETFQYIFGDLYTKFLTISGKFFNVDLGIYIGDRFKDKKDKEVIDQAATQALGNATDKELILDLINVLEADSAPESKAILEKGLKAFNELQEANAKAAQEAQQAELQDKQEERAHLVKLQEMKDVNQIEVAKIYANNKTFNDAQNRTSDELKTLAKIEADDLKDQRAILNKEKSTQK
jgi:hypothetical protein